MFIALKTVEDNEEENMREDSAPAFSKPRAGEDIDRLVRRQRNEK